MGGNQTLNIAIPDLKNFSYVGVYSSGLIGSFGTPRAGAAPAAAQPQTPRPSWEEQHAKELDDAVAKKGLKLVWFATGKEDFLLKTSQGTVEMLKKHGFTVTYNETSGAHTWLNWRIYLSEFAPLLFK
jgi:enterochelin esterase family protein